MSGHSKWSNNKNRKMSQDYKRSKIFTKIIRDLIVSSKNGGNNPLNNSKLKLLIEKALSKNMNLNTIKKVINFDNTKLTSSMEKLVYSGYGPGGIAILIDCLSNNKNRTVSSIKHIFNKLGCNFNSDFTAISYIFKKKGIITYSNDIDKDKLINIASKYDIEDIKIHKNGFIDLIVHWKKINFIVNIINSYSFKEICYQNKIIPSIKINVNKVIQPKILNLINNLKDCKDVKKIYHNGIFSD